MNLTHKIKKYGQRVRSADETLRSVQPVLDTVGITRLADITGLDRLGIPTYSAIVPRSRDVLSIYNGKGHRSIDAKVGAIMEAIERHAATQMKLAIRHGSYREIAATSQRGLHPSEVGIELYPEYSDAQSIAWVKGYDILNGEETWIPAEAAGYLLIGRYGPPCFNWSRTSGLASGNVLEECVAHALLELIERDAWTLAELRCRWIPEAIRAHSHNASPVAPASLPAETETEPGSPLSSRSDDTAYPYLDLSDANPVITGLLDRYRAIGLEPLVIDITSDLGVPTVLATAAETIRPGFDRAHFGLGTHLDPNVAITRALTELAQSRVTDIQGVREDLRPSADTEPMQAAHTKRAEMIEKESWYHKPSPQSRQINEMPAVRNDDLLRDIAELLTRLRRAGLDRVIVTDLTHPEAQVPVVRVIVPGLESWAADHQPIGKRAQAFWKHSLQQIHAKTSM